LYLIEREIFKSKERKIREPGGYRVQRLYKVPEAAEMLGLSAKKVWAMVAGRELDVVRIGRCVRIPAHSLDRLIENGTTPASVS
jgi:excisionase family DNA binding protein